MDKYLKIFLIAFAALVILFLGTLFFFLKKSDNKNLLYDFKGIVENVNYDIKGIPTVTINTKEYYLSAGYNFNFQIEKGDTLKKKKYATTYVLIKQKTGKRLLFDN